ncbi:MAG: zinc-binding dehydrogenase [Pacificimonas sp.]
MHSLRSTLTEDGFIELAMHDMPEKELKPTEVLVEVEATPVNPSDLGVMFGVADTEKAETVEREGKKVLRAPVPPAMVDRFRARVGKPVPIGNEGAGRVVKAGSSDMAQGLMGKMVAAVSGAMYASHAKVDATMCFPHNEGTTAVQGASSFVNPLTALGMTETMKAEGHKALVHTAAASNLGQMLNRICLADGIDLVCIVRKPEQAKLLRDAGAKHVVDSSEGSFKKDLVDALAETGATLAFDATGGGTLASDILTCMERAELRKGDEASVYGSTTHKQVYLYGSLDMSPTVLTRNYGMYWGVGGWLLTPFLAKTDPQKVMQLRQRVADEIDTTFKSEYTAEIGLEDVLDAKIAKAMQAKATGEKFLIRP